MTLSEFFDPVAKAESPAVGIFSPNEYPGAGWVIGAHRAGPSD